MGARAGARPGLGRATAVFTPTRLAVLDVLASQAAISLENSRLYREVEEREARSSRLINANIVGVGIWDLNGGITEANDEFLRMVGYTREDLVARRVRWTELTPPEWHDVDARALADFTRTGSVQPYEKEFVRKDGSRVPVLLGSARLASPNEGVAFVLDLTPQKQAEEALREAIGADARGPRRDRRGGDGVARARVEPAARRDRRQCARLPRGARRTAEPRRHVRGAARHRQ